MPSLQPPPSIAWFGERSAAYVPSSVASSAPAQDDAVQLAALCERLKTGDMRARRTLAAFIEHCSDARVRYDALHLFCAVARHEDLAFLEMRLAHGDHDEVFAIVVWLPHTLSAEAIPLLFALHERYAGTTLEEPILSAIDSLFPFGYEGGSIAMHELAPHFSGFAHALQAGAYYYRGRPAFAGDLTQPLIQAAAQARYHKTGYPLDAVPDLLSVWSGEHCPVGAGDDVDDERFEAVLAYVGILSRMSWTRGRKYFYGHDIALPASPMQLMQTRFTCGTCAHTFAAPDMHGAPYGNFLMRSQASGQLRLLDAMADPTFDEVDQLLLEHASIRALSPGKRAKLLHEIYGPLACDPDAQAMPFMIGAPPACPACGGRDMASWEEAGAGDAVEADAPAPSHFAWSALGEAGKRQALVVALAASGYPV